jgi:hypothetical protein
VSEPEFFINGIKMLDEREFVNTLDEMQETLVMDRDSIQEDLGVSEDTASAIQYLRSRSRWTPEKELELVVRDKLGNPIPLGTVLSGEF